MGPNDREQWCEVRLSFLTATPAAARIPTDRLHSTHAVVRHSQPSRRRETNFLRRHKAHGRSTPRVKPHETKTRDDALDLLSFDISTPLGRQDHFRHRCFHFDPRHGYSVLRDVYSGKRADRYKDISSRTVYFSRVEHNRLVHAENGNTAATSNTLCHIEERRQGPTTYLSSKARNRLAQTVHGNTTQRMSPQELYDSLVCVPVQPKRCRARVYTLSQCLRSPQEGSNFCAQHSKTLQHGRFDNPVLPRLQEKFLQSGYKLLQPKQYQWYSRRRMWHFAEERRKNSVDELEDQEFLIGLGVVNAYFKVNSSYRASWGLEAKRGPQGLEDRHNTEKLDYLGDPTVYKHYDKEIFVDELKFLGDTVTPDNASERQFEEALLRTTQRIQQRWIRRSLSEEYRGPQSYVHRTQPERLNFTFSSTSQHAPLIPDQGAINWLRCSECSSWRRVDLQTFTAYSAAVYLQQAKVQRRQHLASDYPSFAPHLAAQLELRLVEFEEEMAETTVSKPRSQRRNTSGCTPDEAPQRFSLSCACFWNILASASSVKIRALESEAEPQTKRAVLELCRDLCLEKDIAAAGIEDACLEYDNQDNAPLFRCSSLVACACGDPCDAAAATTDPSAFVEYRRAGAEPLVLRDAANEDVEFTAVFHGFSSEATGEAEETTPHSCCVVGCGNTFPEDHPSGFTYVPKNKNSKQNTRWSICAICITRVCRRLRKAHRRRRSESVCGRRRNCKRTRLGNAAS